MSSISASISSHSRCVTRPNDSGKSTTYFPFQDIEEATSCLRQDNVRPAENIAGSYLRSPRIIVGVALDRGEDGRRPRETLLIDPGGEGIPVGDPAPLFQPVGRSRQVCDGHTGRKQLDLGREYLVHRPRAEVRLRSSSEMVSIVFPVQDEWNGG